MRSLYMQAAMMHQKQPPASKQASNNDVICCAMETGGIWHNLCIVEWTHFGDSVAPKLNVDQSLPPHAGHNGFVPQSLLHNRCGVRHSRQLCVCDVCAISIYHLYSNMLVCVSMPLQSKR